MVDQRTPAGDASGQGTDPVQRWLPWLLRLVWIATGVAGSAAVTDAVDGRSTGVELAATWGAAAGWVVGVAAMAVPATLSLTATRVVIPLAVVAAVTSLVAGASAGPGAVFLGLAAASTAVALSGELGRAFVQASAYGNEERFPLRPPVGFAVAAVLAWILWSAALVIGALLTGAQVWLAGISLVALAAVGAVVLGRRWHFLSRRWLVFVPAGLVLHDRVVLGETLMLRRSQLDRLRLAPADTEALDLTGPASGHAIEMTVREMVTVLLPPSTEHPNGRALHVRAFLAGPSRPGSALTAARRRHFPVG